MRFLQLVVLLSCFYSYSAVQQSFTFYAGQNFTGESITVFDTVPDASLISPIIYERKSFCVQGWWLTMREKNYNENDGVGSVWWSKSDEMHCIGVIDNDIYRGYMSLRHVGNSDTDKAGLSLYGGSYLYGPEFYVGEDADAPEVPFPVISYGMTGSSSWTFYVEPNYQGFHYCVTVMDGNVQTIHPTGTSVNIKSVRRGCHLD